MQEKKTLSRTFPLLLAVASFFICSSAKAQWDLRVELGPLDTIPALGARWSAEVGTNAGVWLASGSTIGELSGIVPLSYTTIDGYYSPVETTIIIDNHSNVVHYYNVWSNFFQIEPIRGPEDINPGSVISAPWTLDSPPTFTTVETGVGRIDNVRCPTGTYTVAWGELPGWNTPSPVLIDIDDLAMPKVVFTGIYTRVTGTIDISHAPSSVTNATWTLTSPDPAVQTDFNFYTGLPYPLHGTNAMTITNAPEGMYVVRWYRVEGYRIPPAQTNYHDSFTEFRGTYDEGVRLNVHVYQPGEAVPATDPDDLSERTPRATGNTVFVDGIGAGSVLVERLVGNDAVELSPISPNTWSLTPGDSVRVTATPAPITVEGVQYDSFFYEWWITNSITMNPYVIQTRPHQTNDVNLGLLFSREYNPWDNVGDLDQDGLPDEWERRWGLDPKDRRGIHGASGNPSGDFVPSASTRAPIQLTTEGYTFTYRAEEGLVPAYPLRGDRLFLGYNSTNTPFNNILQARGFDGFYKTNGLVDGVPDWVPDDDPYTDPTIRDTDEDGFWDGWEYYFWRWRSADAAARGLPGVMSNAWVDISPIRWNDNSWDTDNDGLSDLQEFQIGTDPTHADTDGDGMDDYWEYTSLQPAGVSSNACHPLYRNDWNANPSLDYYAVVVGRGTIIEGRVGTPFPYPVYRAPGNIYWADVSGSGDFTIFKDKILGGTGTITNNTTGTLIEDTYYGNSEDMPRYRHGDAIWAGGSPYETDHTIIFNPPLKHLDVYTMPPDEPGPGITSFDPRTGWAYPSIAFATNNHPNTMPFINYEQYRGANHYGRLSWGADGYAYTEDPDDTWTHPHTLDSDEDGMPDGWELYVGLDPMFGGDAANDPDDDGLSNLHEWANTNHPLSTAYSWPNKPWPTDPGVVVAPAPNDPHPHDTDFDGLSDGAERAAGTNPTNWDTDGDNLPDGWEVYAGTDPLRSDAFEDLDGDGLLNWQEYWTGTVDEWMLCDPAWGMQFATRAVMPWNRPGDDEFAEPHRYFFIPPSFLSCPSFMYINRVFHPYFNTDEEVLAFLRENYPASDAAPHSEYHTTLANNPDSDGDGMNDYWEVFHGLNPLNGLYFFMEPARYRLRRNPLDELTSFFYDAVPSTPKFEIGAYPSFTPINSIQELLFTIGTNSIHQRMFVGPHHFGLSGMDPDGDGLPNIDEYSYMENRAVYHTCPTPYSRTDRNDPGSFVRMNYDHDYFDIGWWAFGGTATPFRFGSVEGFDTDNDGVGDYEEIAGMGANAANAVDFRTPPRNRALFLNGSDSFLRVVNGFMYLKGSPTLTRFSVEAWIKQVESLNREQVIIERAGLYLDPHNPTTNLIRANFRMGLNAEGRPYIAYNGAGSVTLYMATAKIGHVVEPGVWTHIAGTYDGTYLTIYINGRASASVRTTELPANINMKSICIGARDLNPGYSILYETPVPRDMYKGYIDEVRVWTRARTVEEISETMYRGLTRDEVNNFSRLYTYYTFNDVPDPDIEPIVPRGLGDLDPMFKFHPTIPWWRNLPHRSRVYTGSPQMPYNYIVFAIDQVFHRPRVPAWDDFLRTSELATVIETNIMGTVTTNIISVGVQDLPDDYINVINPYHNYNDANQELNQDLLLLGGARTVAVTNTWLGGVGDGADMVDTDGDGLPDWWEVMHGLDPFDATGEHGAWGDPDGDGLPNIAEYLAGTDPRDFDTNQDGHSDYYASDGPGHLTYGELYTDGDGMCDLWEITHGLDPTRYDAHEDPDGDGWSNWAEFMAGTDPSNPASFPTPLVSGAILFNGEMEGTMRVIGYQTNSMDGPIKASQIGLDFRVSEVVGYADGTLSFSGRLPYAPVPAGTAVEIAVIMYYLHPSGMVTYDYITYTFTGPEEFTYSGPGQGVDAGASGRLNYNTGAFTLNWARDQVPARGNEISVSYPYVDPDNPRFSIEGFKEGYVYIAGYMDLNNNEQWDPGEPFGIAQPNPINLSYRDVDGLKIALRRNEEIPHFPRFKWSEATSTNHVRVTIQNLGSGANIIDAYINNPRNYFHEWDYMRFGYPDGLPAGNYRWKAGPDSGYFSVKDPAPLNTPQLVKPRGEVLRYAQNEIVWQMDAHATRYRLQIVTPTNAYVDTWFEAPYTDRDGHMRADLPYAGNWDGKTFFWRIMAGNKVHESEWSEWQSFSINLSPSVATKEIVGDIFYYGKVPASNVVIEVFNNDAFTGVPEARVDFKIPVTDNPHKLNYNIKGLRPGVYFVRAFLDVEPAGGTRSGQCEFWSSRGFYIANSARNRRPSPVDALTAYRVSNVDIFIHDHDTDNDKMPDAWEMWYFGTMEYTGDMDFDGDGISNLEEYAIAQLNTDPTLWDTSGDGLSDWFKMNYGSPPGKYNPYCPVNNPAGVDLNALAIDTDGDGFPDVLEIFVYGTDPLDPNCYPRNPAAYATGFGATADFDGDGRTDLGIFYQIGGQWYIMTWEGHFYALPFGWSQTIPLVGDFDGDGRSDIAVYYPSAGTWYIWTWAGHYYAIDFGGPGLTPVPGDYSGDGRTDLGVFCENSGVWHILTWQGDYYTVPFGWPGVMPVTGDFNGDGRTDFAVFHQPSGQWHILTWSGQYYALQFGWNETIPVPGDYDGDRRTDLAVYHLTTGNWYILTWQGHYYQINFGWNETIPVPGDYSGDKRHDLAVYHPPTGNWYIWTWVGHFYQRQFGWGEAAPPQKGRH